MSTSYTWIINDLQRETADGYVFRAHWQLVAADGAYTETASGTAKFDRPETLIPFDSLSKELVVQWIQDSYGSEKLAEVQAELEARLSQKRSPTKAYGMPEAWDTDSSVDEGAS